MERWPRDRLVTALRLLAVLPPAPCGVTITDCCRELDVKKGAFYRLVADMRRAGISIEANTMRNGRRSYYVAGGGRELLEKLLREVADL